MVDRAAAAGYEALVLTVDTAVLGRRERDVRRGFSLAADDRARHARRRRAPSGLDVAFVRSEPIRFANVVGRDVGDGAHRSPSSTTSTPSSTRRCRGTTSTGCARCGTGPIVSRASRPSPTRCSPPSRVDAIALSNHGGRQLDGAPAPFSLVAPVADAVGGRTEIICDGGVRRGSDIVKAVAAGATACMAGRAYLYGLGAAGERGVDRVLGWFRADLSAR